MTNTSNLCRNEIHTNCLNMEVYNLTAHQIITYYTEENKTTKEIAKLAGVSYQSICNVLKNHNITILPYKKKYHSAICTEYFNGKSISELVIKYDLGFSTIWQLLKRNNVTMRPALYKKGKENPLYKGINYKGCDGYLITPTGKREHRVLMEKELQRSLFSWEHVHHINENRTDNSLANLIVMPAKEHNRFHTFLRHRKKISCFDEVENLCKKESSYYYRFTLIELNLAITKYPELTSFYKKKEKRICRVSGCSNFEYGNQKVCNKHYQENRAKIKGYWSSGKGRISKCLK